MVTVKNCIDWLEMETFSVDEEDTDLKTLNLYVRLVCNYCSFAADQFAVSRGLKFLKSLPLGPILTGTL